MKLASLTLDGVLGAPDGTFSFLGIDGRPAPLVLLRGPNVAGKTSVLRAIAALKEQAGAYGAPPRPSALRRRGRSSGRICGTWLLSEEEQRLAGVDCDTLVTELLLDDAVVQPLGEPGLRRLMSMADPPPRVGRFEFIPAERALVDGAPVLAGPPEVAQRARNSPTKYAGLATWFVDRWLADATTTLREVEDKGFVSAWDRPHSLRSLRTALAGLLPSLRLRGVEPAATGHRVVFERDDGATFDLFELSSSQRDLVLMCLIVHRQRLDHSLVLIDEPVLAVSKERRATVMRSLAALSAGTQLVVASSAPELSSAVHHQVEIDLERVRRASSESASDRAEDQ